MKSLFDKVWDQHVVLPETEDTPAVLYIDLHLIHEVSTPQAFAALRDAGIAVRRPERTIATLDHATPTVPATSLKEIEIVSQPAAAKQIAELMRNCEDFGIQLFGLGSDYRGIVHVIGPELGATQPGKTIVCGDSHTSTHGAFGALAFGIGTTEVGHVLASQCLLQRRPRTFAVTINGHPGEGVSAKDIILAVVGQVGVNGGTGHVIEYRGSTIPALTMDQRMTICNMSIEAGARAGMMAPDDTTFEYLNGLPMAPTGNDWAKALERWQGLRSDPDASFDKELSLDISKLAPMVTFGTNPSMVIPVDGTVPASGDAGFNKALDYMQVEAGQPLLGKPVDVVFIGSCTNSRLSDLREAASIFENRSVPENVRALIVPGSEHIKQAAEAEGLDRIFEAAGAEWRETGCSMCVAMNGDMVGPGKLAVSTSNRNFEGRQGPGARTILASPLTAAAAAVTGVVADPRPLLH